MLKLKKIAVTGGIASGKTAVCQILKTLGAYIVSADEIVHQLLSPKTTLGQKVIKLVGSDIVVNNQIDRSSIAKKVFKQPELLQKLESLVHPAVFKEIQQQYLKASSQFPTPSLFVAEIPLLFEAGYDQFFDDVIAVKADPQLCQERFGSTDYKERARRQLSPDEKASRADYVIENNGTIEDLKTNVHTIYYMLTQ